MKPTQRKFNVPHTIVFTDEVALTVEGILSRYAYIPPEDGEAESDPRSEWYFKGAREMALEIIAHLRDNPGRIVALFDDGVGWHERLNGLCKYARELDAERLEALIQIRKMQEERATRDPQDNGNVKSVQRPPRRARGRKR